MTSVTHCMDCEKKLTLKQRREYQHDCADCHVKSCTKMLKKFCRKGSTMYTVIRHVSKSGMSRRIDCYSIHRGELTYLSGYIEGITGWKRHRDGGLIVSGCGMDMGFHIIYNVSAALYGHDNRGGYEISHSWI